MLWRSVRANAISEPFRVVLIAPENDPHAAAVRASLLEMEAEVCQFSLSDVLERSFSVEPGSAIRLDESLIDEAWAVWWRRLGAVPSGDLAPDEARLRAEETEALVVGALLSVISRWVDEPSCVARAEHSLVQLATAKRAGAPTPMSVVTNDISAVTSLGRDHRLLAKATSAGIGLAPNAEVVDPALFPLLQHAPTLLQELVPASADLRIVVVGQETLAWTRSKTIGEPPDWRTADPAGRGFVKHSLEKQVADWAVQININLGLNFSVQDWLISPNGYTFLEVNPSGQWLFLTGAESSVPPALANLLRSPQRFVAHASPARITGQGETT